MFELFSFFIDYALQTDMIYLSIRDNNVEVFDNVSGTGARRIFSEGAHERRRNPEPT